MRARALIAFAILEDGPIYAPILERIEREILAYQAREDVVARARGYLNELRDQAAAARGVASEGVRAIR